MSLLFKPEKVNQANNAMSQFKIVRSNRYKRKHPLAVYMVSFINKYPLPQIIHR